MTKNHKLRRHICTALLLVTLTVACDQKSENLSALLGHLDQLYADSDGARERIELELNSKSGLSIEASLRSGYYSRREATGKLTTIEDENLLAALRGVGIISARKLDNAKIVIELDVVSAIGGSSDYQLFVFLENGMHEKDLPDCEIAYEESTPFECEYRPATSSEWVYRIVYLSIDPDSSNFSFGAEQ